MICSDKCKIGDHGEMVRGEGQGGKSVLADLLLGGHIQGGGGLDAPGVEDVVQGALLLPSLSDLPGGERCRVRVGGDQLLLDGADHCLGGVGVEVPCQDQRPVLLHCGQPGQEILALLVPQGGQQGS